MNTVNTVNDPAPIIQDARYVKGKKAVVCPPNGEWKSRAARLACALPHSYSNREGAYIMSDAAARRLVALWEAGAEASTVNRVIYSEWPRGAA